MEKMKRNKGFTLIELMVVIVIIGILAGLTLTGFAGARKVARDGKRKADLEQIRSALEIYRSDRGGYPLRVNELSGWEISNDGDWLENLPADYLAQPPVDPLNNTNYNYRYALCFGSVTATSMPNYKLYARMESGGNTQLCPQCSGSTGDVNWYCITSP